MSVRLVAVVAAVAGGLVWTFRWITDGPAPLHWVGLALLGVAVAGLGARLVRSSAVPLRAVVAVGSALLVLSLVELVRPQPDPAGFDAVLGVLMLLGAGGALLAAPRAEVQQGRRRAG